MALWQPRPNDEITEEPLEQQQQPQEQPLEQPQEYQFSWDSYLTLYVPLYKAARSGDWNTAERLLNEAPNLVRTPITEVGGTALHVAAVEGHLPFVQNLLNRMNPDHMRIPDKNGRTALFVAIAAGHLSIVQLMSDRDRGLLSIPDCQGIRPVYMAALQGHKDMAEDLFSRDMEEDLFSRSNFRSWEEADQIELLMRCIDSGLYDLAKDIVDQNKRLVTTSDRMGETPLEVLVKRPLAIRSSNQKGWWVKIATILSAVRLKKGQEEEARCGAYELLQYLWNVMILGDRTEVARFHEIALKLLFIAAKFGNDELLVKLIREFPDLWYRKNDSNRSIFHIAVKYRYIRVFNLIYESRGFKEIATNVDNDGNNILHLAAKLAPQNQLNYIPGPVLQMQQEIRWYKKIEKIVYPTYRKMKNNDGRTPHDLFLHKHKKLMEEGEKVMKQIAKSCMLVTILIATIVFTIAFTVPGGYNNDTGTPILQKKKLFIIFPISEAVATLSSLTSMLMFVYILSSSYTEMDFLRSLPLCMVTGVVALFIALVAMMMMLCNSLLLYQQGVVIGIILLVFFACISIMLFMLKLPFLVTLLRSSYCGQLLFQSNNDYLPSNLFLDSV